MSSPKFRLLLFGPPRLEEDEVPIPIRPRRAFALFIYLAATHRSHSRDVLAALLWPEYDQQSARAHLRRTLYLLNQTPAEQLIEATPEIIALAPDADLDLDIDEFQRCVTGVELDEVTIEQLERAANLYTDDFLAGFSLPDCPEYDEWQFFQREELRRSLAQVLRRLVNRCEQQDRLETALQYARRWLALDPLDEEIHGRLMQLYARSGQWTAAVRQYQECERILEEELDVAPSAQTRTLYETVAKQRRAQQEPVGEIGTLSEPPAQKLEAEPEKETRSLFEHTRAKGVDSPTRPALPAFDMAQSTSAPQIQTLSDEEPTNISGTAAPRTRLSPVHNLPAQAIPIVGREQELMEIVDRLRDPDCRLLTLVGPGGIGKTRLAIQAARQWVETRCAMFDPDMVDPGLFADGVFFVPLDAVDAASDIGAAVAKTLNIRLQDGSDATMQVLDALSDRSLLLVLDNFEHLLDGVDFVIEILCAAPSIKLLVTSRQALRLYEEWFYPLGGLVFPQRAPNAAGLVEGQQLEAFDAVRLFVQGARRVRPDFSLQRECDHVVQICRLMEGMPLGIELAAAWVRMLSCAEIVRQLEMGLDLLTVHYHNMPERHHSLHAVFEQTWRQLSPAEQDVLGKLSVTRGGFTHQAAEVVAGSTLDVLSSLMDKALLNRQQAATPDGSARYSYHPLLQQYATQKLDEMPQQRADTRYRHARYYLELVEMQRETLRSAERRTVSALFATELPNIRTAWLWIVEVKDIDAMARLALPVAALFEGHEQEGERLFAQAAAVLDENDPSHQAALGAVLVAQARQLRWRGADLTRSGLLVERALRLLEQSNDLHTKLNALDILGNVLWMQGDYPRAQQVADQGLALARAVGSASEVGELLIRQGLIKRELEDAETVWTFYQHTLAELRALGDRANLAHQLLIYGEYLVVCGEARRGLVFLEESLALVEEMGGELGFYPFILMHIALAAYRIGDYARAESTLQTVVTVAERDNLVHAIALTQLFLGRVKTAQSQLAAAAGHLHQGLLLGRHHNLTLVTTLALVCIGEWYVAAGNTEGAVALLIAAYTHPATEQRDKQDAQRLLVSLRETLAPDRFDAAAAEGRALTLEEIVDRLVRTPLSNANFSTAISEKDEDQRLGTRRSQEGRNHFRPS